MAKNSILLIDLENFCRCRSDYVKEWQRDYEPARDVENVKLFADDIAGERNIIMRRAYANFPSLGVKRFPSRLMEIGIEPRQVYSFTGGFNSKNAADMEIALEAQRIAACTDAAVDQLILVSGDGDFIPLLQHLKLRGMEVVVIAAKGGAHPVISPFCTVYHIFEELLAQKQLPLVRSALHKILESGPHKHRELEEAFRHANPWFKLSHYRCQSFKEFLIRLQTDLELEIGNIGRKQLTVRLPAACTDSDAPTSVMSTVDFYRGLLTKVDPVTMLIPSQEWESITNSVFDLMQDGGCESLDALVEVISEDLGDQGIDQPRIKVDSAISQLIQTQSSFIPLDGDDSLAPGYAAWSRRVGLHPSIGSSEDLRREAGRFIVSLLCQRIQIDEQGAALDMDAVTELLCGPQPTAEQRAQVVSHSHDCLGAVSLQTV